MFMLLTNGSDQDMNACYRDYLRNHNYNEQCIDTYVEMFSRNSPQEKREILEKVGAEFI